MDGIARLDDRAAISTAPRRDRIIQPQATALLASVMAG